MVQRDQLSAEDYLHNLNLLTQGVEDLNIVVERIVGSLNARGFGVMADIDGMMRGVRDNLTAVVHGSESIAAQLKQLQGIVEISALLTSAQPLGDVLEHVLDIIIDLAGAERAYLLTCEGDHCMLVSARNWEGETLDDARVVYSDTVVRSTINTAEPVLTIDAQGDDRFQSKQSVVKHVLRSILCMPLIAHGGVIGVLYIDNRIEEGVFDETTARLLGAFANQAALAIENARLYEQAHQ